MEEKESILVVEDEEKIRSALVDFLEFHDFEVAEAAELFRKAEESHSEWQRKLVDLDDELDQLRRSSRNRAEQEREPQETPLGDASRPGARGALVPAEGQERHRVDRSLLSGSAEAS